jgi:hypothetical protein
MQWVLFDDLAISGQQPLCVCQQCGMRFHDVRDAAALDAYYAQHDYYSQTTTGGAGGHRQVDQGRYQRLWQRIAPLLAAIPHNAQYFDIGCGQGGWLRYVKTQKNDAHLWGLDASHACRLQLKTTGFIHPVATVHELPHNSSPHVITLSHVLEHLYCPQDLLKQLLGLATSNTLFYIEVPDTEALPHSQWPWSWCYFEHINHFCRYTLQALCQQVGLSVHQIGTWPFHPDDQTIDAQCLYVLCYPAQSQTDHLPPPVQADAWQVSRQIQQALQATRAIIEPAIYEEIMTCSGQMGCWGLSQYAMLLLGLYPELRQKIQWLFDSSPAKIGRAIDGHVIQPAQAIGRLRHLDKMIITRSSYTQQMLNELSVMNFDGRVFVI